MIKYSFIIFSALFITVLTLSDFPLFAKEETGKCDKMRQKKQLLAQLFLESKKCKVIFRMAYGKRKICRYSAKGTIVTYDFDAKGNLMEEPMSFTIDQLNPKMNVTIHSFNKKFSTVFLYWKNRKETRCIHDSANIYLDKVGWGTKLYGMKYGKLLK